MLRRREDNGERSIIFADIVRVGFSGERARELNLPGWKSSVLSREPKAVAMSMACSRNARPGDRRLERG